MAKQLDNEKDLEESRKATEGGNSNFIKIETGLTPIYIMSKNYEEGFAHWVQLPGHSKKSKVSCKGGLAGKGFAIDICPICDEVLRLFNEGKEYRANDDEAEADALKKKGNENKARYSVELIVAKGELVNVRKNGKVIKEADFTTEDSKVGVLALSEAQFHSLLDLKGSEDYPFIKTFKDLYNRIIVIDKKKRGKDIMESVVWKPMSKPSEPPDLEWNEEDFNIAADFEIDETKIKQVMKYLVGDSEGGDIDNIQDDSDDFDIKEDEPEERSKTRKSSEAKQVPKEEIDDDFDYDSPDEENVDDFVDDIPLTKEEKLQQKNKKEINKKPISKKGRK